MSFNRGFIYILASNFPFDDYPIETIQILQNQNNQNMMVLIPTNHYMVIVSQNSDQGQVLVLQFAVQNVQARDKDNRIVYLGNSLYSIGPETSLSAVLQATPVTLVIYGRILTLVMVIIAFGFAILKVNYKIDNLCILMTSCYLLLPTSNLVADSAAI